MLQHILHLASDSALSQFEQLDRISHNVANVNTVGFKGRRFEQYLQVDGTIAGVERRDVSQGSTVLTKRPLDIAIEGPGYLPVTQADGTVAYTRDGSLLKDAQGYLKTARGDLVGNGIQLPTYYHKVFFAENGAVQVQLNPGDELTNIGQLQLVHFTNAEGLASIGGNKLVPTADSGPAQPIDTGHDGVEFGSRFRQGYLERANVNMHDQIDKVLRLNAGVISNLKLAKFTDDLFRQAVNLRQ